jgi:hypothetical protein
MKFFGNLSLLLTFAVMAFVDGTAIATEDAVRPPPDQCTLCTYYYNDCMNAC